ncbi:hypothetical protein RAC83_002238, partial [Xylella fastidiosa]|nr:hypothetical protein [Xylella fastidiosa]
MKSKSPRRSSGLRLSTEQAIDQAVIKARCEADHLFFTRYFFKQRQQLRFRVNWHHQVIAGVVDDVIAGRRKDVVINVPPGSSKTELVA